MTRYLALARQLGAEVISTPGTDIGEALLRIAREHNVTQIVIGKPLGSRWTSFLKRDPLRWLMRNSGNIDIHMIPAEESVQPRRETIEERLARAPWRDFGVALVIAAVVTALVLIDLRLHWLLGCCAFLFAGRRSRRHTITPVADAVSRRAQRVTLGFSVHSAALHFLHHPFSRLHDVRRLFRDRARHRSLGDTIARTRTSGAPPRERATAFYRFTRALAASRDLDQALPKVFALIKESFKPMPRFGCVTRTAFLVTRRAPSRRRARMKASRSGRFRKNKRRKIDRHVSGCRVVACAARYRRRR